MEEIKAEQNFLISDLFLIRTPLLSLEVLKDIAESDDLDTLLIKFFTDPVVAESLYLATPELYRTTLGWIENGDIKDRNQPGFRNALMKYLIRMSSRCTPFGMFAGIATGLFSERTDIKLSPSSDHKLYIRPDMQYLCSLTEEISQDHDIRERCSYSLNSSFTRIGDEYRYVEYYTDELGIRKYSLQKTPITPSLEAVVEMPNSGLDVNTLTKAVQQQRFEKDEAKEYIYSLIDNQVLVGSLEPRVSGNAYMDELLHSLMDYRVKPKLKPLFEINDLIKKHAEAGPDQKIDHLRSMQKAAASSQIKIKEGSLLQADLKMAYESNILSENIRAQLHDVLPALMKLAVAAESTLMNNFKDAFVRRYDTREIPLSLAMDTEAGPGYLPEDGNSNASSLLDGLHIPAKPHLETKVSWDDRHALMYRKLQMALLSGEKTIYIEDDDLESLSELKLDFPPGMAMLTRIISCNDLELDNNLIQLESVGGSSAMNLAGRFCYMDTNLNEKMREIATNEQEIIGDTILAEIVHLPQQRTGNILMRPVLRNYEIPYLARPAVDDEHIISIDELRVSVKQGRVVLRSERLNKYIEPRLSNAHNYSMGSLPIYRFLCDMQTQGLCTNLSFSWRALEMGAVFLPRVMYKNIILHAAQWMLTKEDYQNLIDAKDDKRLQASANLIREKFQLPEEILIVEGDNELWIDLGNIHCLKLLQSELRKKNSITVQEYFSPGNDSPLKSDDGVHANEFIFFLTQDKRSL